VVVAEHPHAAVELFLADVERDVADRPVGAPRILPPAPRQGALRQGFGLARERPGQLPEQPCQMRVSKAFEIHYADVGRNWEQRYVDDRTAVDALGH
jgi:hypothetical protein